MWFLDEKPARAAAYLCDEDVLTESKQASLVLRGNQHNRWMAAYYDALLDRLDNLPKKHGNKKSTRPVASLHTVPTASIVTTHRIDYVKTRGGYAKWSEGCPGWFWRMANSLLLKRELKGFLSRNESPRPSRADDERSERVERLDSRDAPVAEISGDNGDKFILW